MALTEQDWKRHISAPVREKPIPFNEALLRQAALDSSLLTGHPEWDKYLQKLQAYLDQAQVELKGWQEKVCGAYQDADLRLVQMNINMCRERIATLQLCMSLPKEIIQHATQHGLVARSNG